MLFYELQLDRKSIRTHWQLPKRRKSYSPILDKYFYNNIQENQTLIIDPINHVAKFTYDDNGNQLTKTLPDGSTEYFEYDFKGRMIKQISFEGVVITYQYDTYDRLESKTFTQNGVSETWIYTYDSLGGVSEIDQNGRVTKTTYDSQGRTILIETPEGTISYTYFPRTLPSTPSCSCHDRATYDRPTFQTWHDPRMRTDDAYRRVEY